MFPMPALTRATLPGVAFLLCLSGCTAVDSFEKPAHIAAWAAKQGFLATDVRAGVFQLAVFIRDAPAAGDTMPVYIEGDGAAWITPYHPPLDPTPKQPVSLALAAADPARKVAYIGRPCQYLDAEALASCDSAFWTGRRFAPEVIAAYDEALDGLKSSLGVRRFRLIGYSGGGVIATLLAARRDDVELLVTVAAPLAVAEWVAWHGTSPLTGSLDPADPDEKSRFPASVHFAGEKDRIVPAPIVEKFIRRKGGDMEVIPGFGHDCCWARDWLELLGRASARKDTK